jgi:hypothetical protein
MGYRLLHMPGTNEYKQVHGKRSRQQYAYQNTIMGAVQLSLSITQEISSCIYIAAKNTVCTLYKWSWAYDTSYFTVSVHCLPT